MNNEEQAIKYKRQKASGVKTITNKVNMKFINR